MTMTTPSSVQRQVESALVTLLRLELAVETRPVVQTHPEPEVVRVKWAPGDASPSEESPFQKTLGSIPEYLGFLNAGEFSCVLQDGALIQVSYDVRRQAIRRHRLLYYPCPFSLSEHDIGSSGDVAETVEQMADGLRLGEDWDLHSLKLQGPMRFDFDALERKPLHEHSHVHLANDDSRIPLFGPLGVGQFFRFILQSFYSKTWLEEQLARDWPFEHHGYTLDPALESDLHFLCRNAI